MQISYKHFSIVIILFLSSLGTSAQQTYSFTDILSGLAYPVSFDIDNNDNFYVALKGGTNGAAVNASVRVFDPAGNAIGLVWDFSDSTEVYFERGVLGVTLDPDFDNNKFVYVFYNHDVPAKMRVVRFEMVANNGTNPQIILDIDDPSSAGNHSGGNIHFRPSEPNNIYVSIGDRGNSANSQDTTNAFGKILRINSDGSIPTDNPFYDDGDVNNGFDDRIWALGLRNSFDFTFSTVNDSLYASENGHNNQDEVNQIMKGANYGWPECEGVLDYMGGSCATPGLSSPIEIFPSLGTALPAVTGVIMYDHSLMPWFTNHLLVGTYTDGTIRDLALTNGPAFNQLDSVETQFSGQLNKLVDLAQASDGCLFALSGGFTTNGRIVKICPQFDGVSSVNELQVKVYPNPTYGQIKIDTKTDITSCKIFSITGSLLLRSADIHSIDISMLEPGNYLLQLSNPQGIQYTQRIVKL